MSRRPTDTSDNGSAPRTPAERIRDLGAAARGRAFWLTGQAVKRATARVGYTVVKSGPFGPVPDAPAGHPAWSRRSPLGDTAFDYDAQLAFMREALRPYIEEFGRDVRGHGFELWNRLFQAGDAETLYALVRDLKPRRVLEIGSGNSTLVSAAACVANEREGAHTELVAVDPHPRLDIAGRVDGLARFEREDCRKLPIERYAELEPGDILFIDTTHVVKLGGEVNWLVLDVLPRLRRGVWVHLHDIFLPNEYPPYMFYGWVSNEQYLVEAFLTGNDWTVELSLAALFRDRKEELLELVPSLHEEVPGLPELKNWLPASFWIRRREH